jgi:hypothetical protein|nr:MAG TPA: hypothetical protein [Microviridae sp.]
MIQVKQNLTYVLLISVRSLKTNRWLTYKVHSIYRTLRLAQDAGDRLLSRSSCNSLRYKVELCDL